MQLEVIANRYGTQLLCAGRSLYAQRLARMKQRHTNLHWVACIQPIARFASEDQKMALLPATHTALTAIGEIIAQLQPGWTYARI